MGVSTIPFHERSHVLKAETERAFLDPDWFVRQMSEAHAPVCGPEEVQVRIRGNIRGAIELAQLLIGKYGYQPRIRKLSRDKNYREEGVYDRDNVFIDLVDPVRPVGRPAVLIGELPQQETRAACEHCGTLLTPGERRSGKCDYCGTSLQ